MARAFVYALLLPLITLFVLTTIAQPDADGSGWSEHSERRGISILSDSEIRAIYGNKLVLSRAVNIDPDRSLLVRKPERLASLSFEAIMDLLHRTNTAAKPIRDRLRPSTSKACRTDRSLRRRRTGLQGNRGH
jgi:hypothetical protein